MNIDGRRIDPRSIVIHGDDGMENRCGYRAAPPHPTSTFAAESAMEFAEMATDARHTRYYTRYGNPTNERVEAIIAGLEGAEACLLAASGMGAISTAVLTLVNAGDDVIIQRNHYMGTSKLFAELLPRSASPRRLSIRRRRTAFAEALTSRTRLIVVETPANPTMQLTDLAAVATIAKKHGALTLADNTFASRSTSDHSIAGSIW